MIKLEKDTANTVTLTLTENTTITGAVYLFRFVSELTSVEKVFTCTDSSPYPERYNLFTITETSTEDLYNGEVELEKGFHTYEIYEADVESPQPLDLADYSPSLEIVEKGLVYVWETEQELSTFDTGTLTEIPTFNG